MLLLYLCAFNILCAQQIPSPDPVIYRVFYQHEHLRDTSKTAVYKEDMVLLIGQSSSLFSSFEKIRLRVNREEQIKISAVSMSTPVRIEPGRITTPQDYILWYGRDKGVVLGFLERLLVYEDEFAPIDWTILSEEKEIEGLKCYKATTTYRGRNWEVWFTPEINYPAGPWLLRGLPGLILEARDQQGHIAYSLTGIESANVPNEIFDKAPDYKNVQLHSPKSLSRISKKEFQKMWEEAQKDLRGFRLRQMKIMSDRELSGFSDLGILNYYSWSRKIPNPIALDEQ